MHNLLNYSKNFRKTTGSFWDYYPDKPNSNYAGNDERTRLFFPITDSESVHYKTKLIDDLCNNDNAELEDIKIVVPLKNLSNFIFNLNFLMINTKIEFILKWSKNCLLCEKVTREPIPAQDGNPAVNRINRPLLLNFGITDCKLYVPVVTLQEKYENIFYENLKT